MKYFRLGITLVFIITCAVFTAFFVNKRIHTDKTIPQITVEENDLYISVNDDDSALLKGVKASDGKDGDLTDSIIVESISTFINPGECKITYAVCDSDKHVAHKSRTLHYVDYTEPKFTLQKSLVFSSDSAISLKNAIGAVDSIDGDISSNVVLTVPDYEKGQTGSFVVKAEAFNSKGDSITAEFPMTIEETEANAPTIVLNSYLDYIKAGVKLNPYKYLEGAVDYAGNDLTSSVTYKVRKDSGSSGLYKIDYYVTDQRGTEGHTQLLILPEN